MIANFGKSNKQTGRLYMKRGEHADQPGFFSKLAFKLITPFGI